MPSPTEITPSQLSRLIGTPACPKIIDVSIDADFSDDPFLIPTAIRHPFDQIETLSINDPNQTVIVICQKGLKTIPRGRGNPANNGDKCLEPTGWQLRLARCWPDAYTQ